MEWLGQLHWTTFVVPVDASREACAVATGTGGSFITFGFSFPLLLTLFPFLTFFCWN